jgi:hypothetical protein
MYIYDHAYYEYINAGSIRSAEEVLRIVTRQFTIRSVADFGAGQGAWLSVWARFGVTDVTAIDGNYVNASTLLVPPERFVAADLGQCVRLGRVFDLVQSLEVAEHLPASAAGEFVGNLVAHGSMVLFSAAAPGQGGEHHLNERPYQYWRQLFGAHGYVMFDAIRPYLVGNTRVEPWYRYNTFIFAHRTQLDQLPEVVRQRRIKDADVVPDISPLVYRIRKTIIGVLPLWAVTRLAIARKHTHSRLNSAAPTA